MGIQHIAFSALASKDCISDAEFEPIKPIIKLCLEHEIATASFLLYPSGFAKKDNFQAEMDSLLRFMIGLRGWITEHKIRVIALGKWYDLPSRVIDSIKSVMTETAENNELILNLCINYDGQAEIIDACRLIARQVKSGKLDPDSINEDIMKESVYSSQTPKVDIIFMDKYIRGLLMWDSANAKIVQIPWNLKSVDIVHKHIKKKKF